MTRISAARNQLSTAIEMWFLDSDVASTHSLASSAYQIIHDINDSKNGPSLLYDSDIVKDGYRKVWINKLKEPYNNLKHAERNPDPDEEIEIDQKLTEGVIIFSCIGLRFLGFQHSEIEHTFMAYYTVNHPEIMNDDFDFSDNIPATAIEAARSGTKEMFFRALKQLHEQKRCQQ